MPSTSLAQHRFFEAIAHSKEFARKAGVKQSVGRDFVEADKRAGRADGGVVTAPTYDTPLSPSDRAGYQAWKQRIAPNDSGSDYDLAGAYKAGVAPDPDRGHLPDTFKKPNHPTFSDESQYSTSDHPGGSWSSRDGRDVFTPSPYNLQNTPPDQLREYFKKQEPDAMLDISPSGRKSGGAIVRLADGGRMAVALRLAGDSARRRLAEGGQPYTPPSPSFGQREDIRSILSPTAGGIINSEIPGRTDHIPTSVAADSYVIPADVVSGIGEGNSLAGARLLQEWMSTGPHGIPLQRESSRNTIPRPPAAPNQGASSPEFAAGGKTPLKTAHIKNDPNGVPVIVAGGEMLIDPHVIAHHPDLGNLDPNDKNPAHYRRAVNFGHKVLDAFVVSERKKIIKTMSKLRGPKK